MAAQNRCPAPSTHDKMDEAHYFIHQMVDHYHQPDPFRYSLSAFLQAARNVTFVLQNEMAHIAGFGDVWTKIQDEMRGNPDLKLLNDSRVTVVHKSSLVPASSMFIGHFKYGKPNSGFSGMRLSPMMDSAEALAHGRRVCQSFEHPHRLWSGEEFGLQRLWALKEAPGRELVQFALTCLTSISHAFSKAHEWAGCGVHNRADCEHFASDEYRNLRESEIFLEVIKAWDGQPTEELRPANGAISLMASPNDSSEVLHEVPAGGSGQGWINTDRSVFWSQDFASMLVYSIGKETVTRNTSVFFKRSAGVISTLSRTEPDGAEESCDES